MRLLPVAAAVAVALAALTSACEDEQSTIGTSLVTDKVEIVVDSSFTVTGHADPFGAVQSRTTLQLLGRLQAAPYGDFSSDIVTQFMAAERIDTDGVSADRIDSVRLLMRVPAGGFVGDSLMPMGVTVHPLTKALPVPIYSSFDPADYYDPSVTLSSGFYTLTDATTVTTTRGRCISLPLDNAFGQRLLEKYLESPSTFVSPAAFTEFFPGMYIHTSFGAGRVAQVDSTVVTVYFRRASIDDDTGDTVLTADSQTYMAVTPEVTTNNIIAYDAAPSLTARAQAGEAILVAPTGYDVTLRFPADAIIEAFRSHGQNLCVANSLSFSIPVDEIGSDAGLAPPPCVLLVKKSERDKFFAESRLPDNVTSFYAIYDSYYRRYVFSDMRPYLLAMLGQEELTEADMTFSVVPVTIGWENSASSVSSSYYYYTTTASSSAVVASVTPYIQKPSMARLNLGKANITFTYSVQKLNL